MLPPLDLSFFLNVRLRFFLFLSLLQPRDPFWCCEKKNLVLTHSMAQYNEVTNRDAQLTVIGKEHDDDGREHDDVGR